MASVDDLQDSIDRLVLAVFDSVRSHEDFIKISLVNDCNDLKGLTSRISLDMDPVVLNNIHSLHKKHSDKILEEFNSSYDNIIRLKGVSRTRQQQLDEMDTLTQEYQSIKERILVYESQLMQLDKEIDGQLVEVRSLSLY